MLIWIASLILPGAVVWFVEDKNVFGWALLVTLAQLVLPVISIMAWGLTEVFFSFAMLIVILVAYIVNVIIIAILRKIDSEIPIVNVILFFVFTFVINILLRQLPIDVLISSLI